MTDRRCFESHAGKRPRVAVITNMPVHHQVDLFNALHTQEEITLRVFYLRQMSYGREWTAPENIHHDAVFIPEFRIHKHFYVSPGSYGAVSSFHPDLTVVGQYASTAMQRIMWLQSLCRRAWVFWSELPGVEFAEDPIVRNSILRKLLRKIALLPVHWWPAAVWGIGTIAQTTYKNIIRTGINCECLPYFSDLSPYLAIKRCNVIDRKRLRFLYAGGLTIRKGFDLIVAAVEQLAGDSEEFELVVIGAGPLEEKLKCLSPQARRRVIYLGFKQRGELPGIFADADVLLFPSRYDGWGMAAVEGMAARMPVIGSIRSGACVDMILDGSNGFVIDPFQPEALVSRMRHFLQKPLDVGSMGEQARIRARQYDVSVGCRQFAYLVRQSLAIAEEMGCTGGK